MTLIRRVVVISILLFTLRAFALTNGFNSAPIGWNPYYYWFSVNNSTMITNGARFVHTNGIQQACAEVGATFYINIGAHWANATTNAQGVPNADTTDFPAGISPVIDYIHSLKVTNSSGQVFPLGAGLAAQGDRIGSDVEFDEGIAYYWTNAANAFASWGVDYINFDFCDNISGYSFKEQATNFANAVAQSGRPMRIEIVTIQNGSGGLPGAWTPWVANHARSSLDSSATWADLLQRADDYNSVASVTTPGYWNDTDDLQIEVLNQVLTATENRTQYGLCALLGGPLMWSNSMTNMGAATLTLATNLSMLRIHQDAMLQPGTRRARTAGNGGNMDVWARQITNGVAVAFMNGTTNSTNISYNLGTLLGSGVTASATNAIYQTNAGTVSDTFTVSGLASHDIAVYTFSTNGLEVPGNFRDDPADYTDGTSSIYLQLLWDTVTGAAGYTIQMSTNSSAFSDIATTTVRPGTQGSIDTLQIPWGHVRWYRIRSFDNAGNVSAWSDTLRLVGEMPTSHLTGSSTTTNSITIGWSSVGVTPTQGYYIQQDTNTSFATAALTNYFVPILDPEDETYSQPITNSFTAGTTYYFRVVAIATNSFYGTNNGPAMNRPTAYIACAVNGVPIAPSILSIHTYSDNDGSDCDSCRFYIRDNAVNTLGFLVQRSTNGGSSYFTIPYTTDGLICTVNGMTVGVTNNFRVWATNALGYDTNNPATETLRMPNTVPTAGTNWYISTTATGGRNNGTNWTDAWTGLRNINWKRLQPGDFVYIDGGTAGLTYPDAIETYTDGGTNTPITFKVSQEANHTGRVLQRGNIIIRSQYTVLDGSLSSSFAVPDVLNLETITNNINWSIDGNGVVAEGIRANVGKGVRVLWLEVTNVSNLNGLEGLAAVSMSPQVGTSIVGTELAYCWIHDNFANGVGTGINGLESSIGAINTHHNIIEGNRNNIFVIDTGNADITDSLLQDSGTPSMGHPDGIQGALNGVRINRNRIGNSAGGTMYSSFTTPYNGGSVTNGGYVTNTLRGFITNTVIANNFFFKTRSVNSTALALDTEVNNSTSVSGTNVTVADMTISNFVFAGNTAWSSAPEALAIRFPHNANSTTHMQSVIVANNLMLCDSNSGTAIGITAQDMASVIFDYNISCGAQTNVFYGTNSYSNMEALNAGTGFASNSSVRPLCYPNLLRWNLRADDTVARGRGTNLSVLATNIGFLALKTDIAGVDRGSAWAIGAFQSMIVETNAENGLLLRLTFDGDFYSTTNKNIADASGTAHDGIRYGKPESKTNFPISIVSFDGTAAGRFREYTNDILNYGGGQYHSGDYAAVTNLIQSLTNMTNATIMGWVNYDSSDASPSDTIMGNAGLNDLGVWHFGRFGNFRTGFTLSTNTMIADDNFLRFPDDETVTNAWHHYAVTWNGTQHLAIAFYDGVPCWTNGTSAPNVYGLKIAGAYLGIGCWTFEGDPILKTVADGGNDNYPDNGWMRGSMDELRIYNRVLTDAEIYALGQVPDFGNPSSPEEGGGSGESGSTASIGGNAVLGGNATIGR